MGAISTARALPPRAAVPRARRIGEPTQMPTSWSHRRTLIALAFAAVVPGSWLPASAQAQATPGARASLPALQRSGLRMAAPQPTLTRRDAPAAPYDPTDPSLAMDYNSVRNGIDLNGIGRLQTPVPGQPNFAYFCTAQRIGARALITAAHCVTDEQTGKLLPTTGSTVARFRGPGATEGTTAWYDVQASQVRVRNEWKGFNNSDLWQDVAIIRTEEVMPDWITTYSLFGGNPVGQTSTHVGYGTFGGGVGATGFDGRRRWGTNRVDWVPDEPGYYADRVLHIDYDNGTAQFDVFCLALDICDRGTGIEAGTASGDSGGPLFIGNRLAGIASFGSYFCADAQCTPYVADPSRPFNSFGSFHGFAPIADNRPWINSVVPEPGTYVMVGTGLLLLAGIARRRRDA